jgi:hypothetical protein
MKWPAVRFVATIVFAAAGLVVFGCSDDSVQPNAAQKPRYPEATTPEIAIDNLVLSYKDFDIEQYAKLLHPDYVWQNQAGMTPVFYGRSEDSLLTDNLFRGALHTHPDESLWLDKLELGLEPPRPWEPVSDIGGTPCEGCFKTHRIYVVTAVTAGGALTYLPTDLVEIFVAPVDVRGATVYRIIRIDDIHW